MHAHGGAALEADDDHVLAAAHVQLDRAADGDGDAAAVAAVGRGVELLLDRPEAVEPVKASSGQGICSIRQSRLRSSSTSGE